MSRLHGAGLAGLASAANRGRVDDLWDSRGF